MRPVPAALRGSVAAGALTTVVGWLTGASPAAFGAAVGAGATVLVLGSGTVVVDVAARIAPRTSLLVALLTYTLEIVATAGAFVLLSRSSLLDDTVDRRWLGAGVVVVTLVWSFALVIASMRERVPLYDTGPRPEPPPSVGPGAEPGVQRGERSVS